MIRLLLLCAMIFGSSQIISAQVIRRFHQNFEVDSLSSIQIEVEGDVTINTWAGNTVLVEIYITSQNGSAAVLNLLQKEGRYDLEMLNSSLDGTVVQKMKHRQNIKVKGIDMDETIKYTISVPDNFAAEDLQTMRSFRR
jgi:hypothetical protein